MDRSRVTLVVEGVLEMPTLIYFYTITLCILAYGGGINRQNFDDVTCEF